MLEVKELYKQKKIAERYKKLIVRYWNGKWNELRSGVLDELQTPDVLYHGTSINMNGIEEYKKAYKNYLSAFGESSVEIKELIGMGDKVVSRVQLSCMHTGELDGIPPSGKKVEVAAITIFHLVNGKIAEEWEMMDELGMMLQLGLELQVKELS